MCLGSAESTSRRPSQISNGDGIDEILFKRLFCRFFPCLDTLTGFRDQAFQLGESGAIFRQGYRHDGWRIFDIAIANRLRGVIEESSHLIKLGLADRIELVIVADRASHREPQPNLSGRFDSVPGVENTVLLIDNASLVGRDVTAVETRRDSLVQIGVWEQVPRELFNSELVKWEIPVEGVDDPFTIRPHFSKVIEMDPVGIGVASVIEPITSAMLPPLRSLEQLVDIVLVTVGARILQHRLDFLGRWGKPGQVKANPPNEGPNIRFRRGLHSASFQLGQHESIDWIANPPAVSHVRELRLLWGQKGPMPLILGPFRNPLANQFFLLLRQ